MGSPGSNSCRRRRFALAGLVAACSFLAYWGTHGPGPFWQDAGLFVAGMNVGTGLAPPGYPLYLLLGRPFVALFQAVLPGRPYAEAVNVFSAVWAALAAGLTTLSILTLVTPGFRFFRTAARERHGEEPCLAAPALLAGTVGGLLAGLSYSLWFQALTAEAYALNAFFAALMLFVVVQLGAEGPVGPQVSARQRRLLLVLCAVHGLSFGNHPSTVVFVPALAWVAWTARAVLADRRLALTVAATCAACALGPYLYLPWAAGARPATIYHDVVTLRGLVTHVTGSQWTAQEASYGWEPARLAVFPKQLWDELLAVGLLALAVGLRRVVREQPGLARFLGVVAVPAWLLPMAYLQGGEYDFWFLPLYMALFVVAGLGLHEVFARAAARGLAGGVLAIGLIVAALVPPLWVNAPLLDRRHDFVPVDFARNLYRHVAPTGILFASSDQECSLTYYLEAVEGHRPDVIRIDAPVLGMSWYPEYLRRRYPALVPAPAGPVSSEEILEGLIRANAADRTIYISKRPAFALPTGLAWVPAGGLWKLVEGPPFAIALEDWEYVYRNDRPFDRPARDHAPRKVTEGEGWRAVREPYTAQIRRFHMQAWKNLGDWQLAHGAYESSVAAYERLFALDPGFDDAATGFALGKALFALNRDAAALQWLDRARDRLDPRSAAEAYLYLGQLHSRAGRRDEADGCFRAVRALAPDLWKDNAPHLRAGGFLGPAS